MAPAPRIGGAGQVLVVLPAQEGRDVELVLFGRFMHRSLPAVLIEALGRCLVGGTLGIFRTRLRTRFRCSRHRPAGQTLSSLRRARRRVAARARLGAILLVLAPTETDRSQPLQQRLALSFGILSLRELAAARAAFG